MLIDERWQIKSEGQSKSGGSQHGQRVLEQHDAWQMVVAAAQCIQSGYTG
jgi:hypothetical protein